MCISGLGAHGRAPYGPPRRPNSAEGVRTRFQGKDRQRAALHRAAKRTSRSSATSSAKEDAGLPPVPPPAMTYDEEVAEIMRRQMPPGDQKRALNKAKNREMTRQFDAGVRAKAGYH